MGTIREQIQLFAEGFGVFSCFSVNRGRGRDFEVGLGRRAGAFVGQLGELVRGFLVPACAGNLPAKPGMGAQTFGNF